jgi:anti-sigma factor RsiW
MATQEFTCREMVELVTDYFEGALPRSDRRRFERHLSACDGCTTYVEQMREVITTLGRLTEDSIPLEARDALLHAFRDWKAA